MKKLAATLICLSIMAHSSFAQQRTAPKAPSDKPEQTPQYDDPFKGMQEMQSQLMAQLQKMFGGDGSFQMGDSTQNHGFQQFRMPFGESDSTNAKMLGFSFGDNGFQMLSPDGDSTNSGGFRQMQEQMQQMMPQFEQLFQGRMPLNDDPSVVPPMDRQKPKSNKKYQTEKL